MNEKLKTLLEQRATAYNEAKGLVEEAKKNNRELTDDEQRKTDELFAKIETMTKDIRKIEGDEKRTKFLDDNADILKGSTGRVVGPVTETREANVVELRSSHGWTRHVECHDNAQQRTAFLNFLRRGLPGNGWIETRDLQKDSDVTGGFLSLPMKFNAELIQKIDDIVYMRGLATMLPPIGASESIGTPSLDNDPADPTWTAELDIGALDSSMSFGLRELRPHPLARAMRVSKTLLRRSDMDVESIVRERMAYKTGIALEKAYISGTGNNQPLGVMIASNQGISTGRDVSTGNTATSITFDGLINAKMALKPQYRPLATWIFHTDALTQLMKLKDGEGRYLWQPSVVAGMPDSLLGRPLIESLYMSNTFSTGQYVGIFGDFKYYWIVDALSLSIQVLVELYAALNLNGYLWRFETDGMPVLEEAFVRVKLG
jgi:HK97 family phage major capsid protein